MEYDGTSRLRITLLKPDKYSGKTAGLCGYFDHDGRLLYIFRTDLKFLFDVTYGLLVTENR